jgi:DNA-binding protein H-NS
MTVAIYTAEVEPDQDRAGARAAAPTPSKAPLYSRALSSHSLAISLSPLSPATFRMQGFSFMTKHYMTFAGRVLLDIAEDMSMALKSMSIEKLVALKDQIEAMLSSKVVEQRRALESELAKLGRFQGGKSGSKVARGFGARGAVAPKYRNPENPAETWAGRGLKPRWLAAAIKSGKKPEDFLIAGAAASKANGGKKTRKAKKSAKK